MKTLEIINGQKVWAVCTTEGCEGCMFWFNPFCDNPGDNDCVGSLRPDKRTVIFQPYEEEPK